MADEPMSTMKKCTNCGAHTKQDFCPICDGDVRPMTRREYEEDWDRTFANIGKDQKAA